MADYIKKEQEKKEKMDEIMKDPEAQEKMRLQML